MNEKPTERIWTCTIGGPVGDLPRQPDFTMRRAVFDAFRNLTGVDAEYCFSGWGRGALSRVERAIVDNDPTVDEIDEAEAKKPIDMVLHCPKCGMQHIDAPEPSMLAGDAAMHGGEWPDRWTNPPHRSHLCHGCGHIWRPADVPTNGVAAVKTKGKNDMPIVNLAAEVEQPRSMK